MSKVKVKVNNVIYHQGNDGNVKVECHYNHSKIFGFTTLFFDSMEQAKTIRKGSEITIDSKFI